jgi:hypothetical protein
MLFRDVPFDGGDEFLGCEDLEIPVCPSDREIVGRKW